MENRIKCLRFGSIKSGHMRFTPCLDSSKIVVRLLESGSVKEMVFKLSEFLLGKVDDDCCRCSRCCGSVWLAANSLDSCADETVAAATGCGAADVGAAAEAVAVVLDEDFSTG